MNCKICEHEAAPIGTKRGAYRDQLFALARCASCGFTFVADPWTDYPEIYGEAYYRGQGADPMIDYVYELEHPERTIRVHEWRGILEVVRQLTPVNPATTWLDFGCGNGGLVRYVRQATACPIVGFEEGWVADHARSFGIPILRPDELAAREGTCDVVTAIEVIEHVERPVAVLEQIRRLLKPGGVLFMTTGNAEPHRDNMAKWAYVIPEIHISLFEPATLATALGRAGFLPEFVGPLRGFDAILRYKILKNLHKRDRGGWESLLPWPVLTRLADRSHRVTAHPIGRAIEERANP